MARVVCVTHNAIANALGKYVLVAIGADFRAFLLVRDKTTLKENGGAFDCAEYREASSLDTAVDGACFLDGMAMHSGG